MAEHQVCGAFRLERSPNGFRLDELESGLQKGIRRGDEGLALRCAEELDRIGTEGASKRVHTILLHRLMVIFLEDVGIGNYHLWPRLCGWADLVAAARVASASAVRPLECFIRALCGSRKTRAASYMRAVAELVQLPPADIGALRELQVAAPEELPELLAVLRAQLANAAAPPAVGGMPPAAHRAIACLYRYVNIAFRTPGRGKAAALQLLETELGRHVDMTCAIRWKRDIMHLKEGFLLYMVPLAAALFGSEPLHADDAAALFGDAWPRRGPFELPAHVYDKHTRARAGQAYDQLRLPTGAVFGQRSIEYFIHESSRVTPEVFRTPPVYRAVYVWLRTRVFVAPPAAPAAVPAAAPAVVPAAVPAAAPAAVPAFDRARLPPDGALETVFELEARAQLVTSAGKTDSYFATGPDGVRYFIKGPYLSDEPIHEFLRIQALKAARGLPAVEGACCLLVPDRWAGPAAPPLSLRNRVARGRPAPFLVARAVGLAAAGPLPTRTHGSKLWPPTVVADLAAVDPFQLRGQAQLDYVRAIAFRLEHSISDAADRNFLICTVGGVERVLSVDEDAGPPQTLLGMLKKQRCELVRRVAAERAAELSAAERAALAR